MLWHNQVWAQIYCIVFLRDYNEDIERQKEKEKMERKDDRYDITGNKRECKKICTPVME